MTKNLLIICMSIFMVSAAPTTSYAAFGIGTAIKKELKRFGKRVRKEIRRTDDNVKKFFKELKNHKSECERKDDAAIRAQRNYDALVNLQEDIRDQVSQSIGTYEANLFKKRQAGSQYIFVRQMKTYLDKRYRDLGCNPGMQIGDGGNSDVCVRDIAPQKVKMDRLLPKVTNEYVRNSATEYYSSQDKEFVSDDLRQAADIDTYVVPGHIANGLENLAQAQEDVTAAAIRLMKKDVNADFCVEKRRGTTPGRGECHNALSFWNNDVTEAWYNVWDSMAELEEAKIAQAKLESEIIELNQKIQAVNSDARELTPSLNYLKERFSKLNCNWGMQIGQGGNSDPCVREIIKPLAPTQRRMNDLRNFKSELQGTIQHVKSELAYYKGWFIFGGKVTQKNRALKSDMGIYVDEKVTQLLCLQ